MRRVFLVVISIRGDADWKSQILTRPATLHRYFGCDQVPMQRPVDVSLPETNRQSKNEPQSTLPRGAASIPQAGDAQALGKGLTDILAGCLRPDRQFFPPFCPDEY